MSIEFGTVLKSWRIQRRMSQLDLGLTAEVSSRHISFLETGRARPSRDMVLRLCDYLEVPLAARNQLLTAAGLAPAYAKRQMSDGDMVQVSQAVDWMLKRHAPYPAFALDRHWVVKEMNGPAMMLFQSVGISTGDSMIDALAHNQNLRDAIENLDEVIAYTIARLRTEVAHLGGDDVLEAAIEMLQSGAEDAPSPAGEFPSVVATRYRMNGMILSMFSTLSQFGTAEDIALSELRIEMLFPADDQTRKMLIALHDADPATKMGDI
ncbi:MAG: helix-turn-helix domain-containing protein [Rhodobacteraceae bacterium]|nr:helix-turn-helix domain-containing protein [Paracoccaceae bacterium]